MLEQTAVTGCAVVHLSLWKSSKACGEQEVICGYEVVSEVPEPPAKMIDPEITQGTVHLPKG
jgi:hypothetical protein